MAEKPEQQRPGSVEVSERFERALTFTVDKHRTQRRKGTQVPYVAHLLGVCALVLEDGGSEDQAIAALLHDAPEDQGGERTLGEIRREFGDDVADIVSACSDTFEAKKPDWKLRKLSYLEHLEHAPDEVLRVSLADKLYNARAIYRDYGQVGDVLWDRFNAGSEDQLWYYNALADVFTRRYPGVMANELSKTVSELKLVTGTKTTFTPPPES